ncbi:hypothetical protein [Kribbella kalugense]|uniref:Uncharacterized protein n=1 Tax=Kribbella kalugense TaxID=2512221 RepID=A0A4R7ZNL4_9ACTN|nr:hypothetical protein [Kribbella kalugense]TDW19463.1 hypothetical protein EV650_6073 [Kribbella kalugense]
MTENRIARPQPITPEDREFIAQVEQRVPDALFDEVAREFAPANLAPDQLARQMSEAAPGGRLRTAVDAAMSGSRHFGSLPPAERSAAAEQATLAAAQAIDSSLTIERKEPTSRLGLIAGKVADKAVDLAFRGSYRDVANLAANKASERLSGALNWSRFHQMEEAQRHAGAVGPAAAAPQYKPADAASSAKATPASKDGDRGRIARD